MLVTLKGGPHDGVLIERAAEPLMGLMPDDLMYGNNARYALQGTYLAGPDPDSDYVRYAVYTYRGGAT